MAVATGAGGWVGASVGAGVSAGAHAAKIIAAIDKIIIGTYGKRFMLFSLFDIVYVLYILPVFLYNIYTLSRACANSHGTLINAIRCKLKGLYFMQTHPNRLKFKDF
jgi:hypothetical protein